MIKVVPISAQDSSKMILVNSVCAYIYLSVYCSKIGLSVKKDVQSKWDSNEAPNNISSLFVYTIARKAHCIFGCRKKNY